MGARKAFLMVAIVAAVAGPVMASDETIGPVYPIHEPDMLEEMQRILLEKEASGELARLQKEAIERSEKSIMEPRPANIVTRTSSPRTFYWDPSVTAPETITDPEGRVIVAAGTRVNPLDYVSLTQHLLFFDANDADQVGMAANLIEHYEGQVKPVLVAGRVIELMREWKRRLYFDQGGFLVRRFGIAQVPALVSQEGKRLRIDEMELR